MKHDCQRRDSAKSRIRVNRKQRLAGKRAFAFMAGV
jgi:hypothetical protein